MRANSSLSVSLENYLEAIFRLISEKGAARAKDIAKRLKVKRPSVTGALHALSSKGLINYEPYEFVTLTAHGKTLAAEIVRKHEVFREFFMEVLGVEYELADSTACDMEHVVSPEIMERFTRFVEFVKTCPRGGAKWIHGFEYQCDINYDPEHCRRCIELCLRDLDQRKIVEKPAETAQMPLSEMKPGQRGRIIKVTGSGAIRRRLVDMGASSGTRVEVRRMSTMGDPLEIKLKGYSLSIRKKEAALITVELEES